MNRLRRLFWNLAEVNTGHKKEYRILPYLIQRLSYAGFEVACDDAYNVIARRGYDGRPLPILCAHSDTVNHHDGLTVPLVFNAIKNIIHTKGSSQVLGGDDKAGIAIILRLAELAKVKNYKFIAVLTNGEESGRGARNLNPDIYNYASYGIVIDRRHEADVVNEIGNKLCEDRFSDWVISQAPETIKAKAISSCHSDASPMSEYIPAVNISCGYYDPHSSDEYVSVPQMYQTMLWVQNMLENSYSSEISEQNML